MLAPRSSCRKGIIKPHKGIIGPHKGILEPEYRFKNSSSGRAVGSRPMGSGPRTYEPMCPWASWPIGPWAHES